MSSSPYVDVVPDVEALQAPDLFFLNESFIMWVSRVINSVGRLSLLQRMLVELKFRGSNHGCLCFKRSPPRITS